MVVSINPYGPQCPVRNRYTKPKGETSVIPLRCLCPMFNSVSRNGISITSPCVGGIINPQTMEGDLGRTIVGPSKEKILSLRQDEGKGLPSWWPLTGSGGDDEKEWYTVPVPLGGWRSDCLQIEGGVSLRNDPGRETGYHFHTDVSDFRVESTERGDPESVCDVPVTG